MQYISFKATTAILALLPIFAGAQAPDTISGAWKAFNRGQTSSPIHLTGSARIIAGNKETNVPVTVDASSDGSAQLSFQVEGGASTTSWGSIASGRACSRTIGDTSVPLSANECWLAVPWFSPQAVFAGDRDSTIAFTSVTGDGTSLSLAASINLVEGKPAISKKIVAWSTVTITMDTSFLPSTMRYKQQTDDGSFRSVDILIRYSQYKTVNGITLPYQIDRYVNGTLQTTLSFDTPQP